MKLLDYLSRQFVYDAWANREVLAALRARGGELSSPKPLHLLAHILSAERLWLERLKAQPQSMPVWPPGTFEECEAQLSEVSTLWRTYFAELTEDVLAHEIKYKNSKGEAWSSTILDVLTHVPLHSAYHRGQIASRLRADGGTPAYTDFIHAVRQRLIE